MKGIEKAREALRLKRENHAKAIGQSIKNLRNSIQNDDPFLAINSAMNEEISKLKSHLEYLYSLIERYSTIIKNLLGKIDNSIGKIIIDIFYLFINNKYDNPERFDDLMKMCLEIYDASDQAYDILKKNIPILPSKDGLEEYRKKYFNNFDDDLLDLEKMKNIVTTFKQEYKIFNKTKIYASLAVDALFFKPNIKVNSNGTTSGFLVDPKIDKKQFKIFSKDIENFTKFIQKNWQNIVRAGFVFQLNPLNHFYKSIILHIIPHSNGKANSKTIEILYKIKNILKNYRIEIICFSFDGDNCYKVLNQTFYQSYINRLLKYNFIPNSRILSMRINPDFKHIIKRLRYRILTHNIHMNFSIHSPCLNLNGIKSLFKDIPSIVFENLPITKMHDSLPLALFSLKNFVILFEKKMYNEAAFWFPISLTICAMHKKRIGYLNRHFLWETALWFLIFYKKKLDLYQANQLHRNEILNERKYKESIDVLPYSSDVLIEFSNSLFSILTIIEKYENVDVDRTSTDPLEHSFGRSRVRSKDLHTLTKFVQVVNEQNKEQLRKKCKELFSIKGRNFGFGIIMESQNDFPLHFTSSPQVISSQFLKFINIDNSELDENETFDDLFVFVEELSDFIDNNSKKTYSINSITLGTQQAKTIKQRMSFNVSTDKSLFVTFIKQNLPNQKLIKSFFVEFYQKVIEKNANFPQLSEKNQIKKKSLII